MKYIKMLGLAACAAAALMAFAGSASASALTCTSRKTGVNGSNGIDDHTNEWSHMNGTYTLTQGIACGNPHSQVENRKTTVLGGSHIDSVALITEQVTVSDTNTSEVKFANHNSWSTNNSSTLGTGQLTVQSTTNEAQLHATNSGVNGSESINSTVGTYEVTQIKARLT